MATKIELQSPPGAQCDHIASSTLPITKWRWNWGRSRNKSSLLKCPKQINKQKGPSQLQFPPPQQPNIMKELSTLTLVTSFRFPCRLSPEATSASQYPKLSVPSATM